MHPRLVLDIPQSGMSRKRIFERVFDQSGSIPPRKKIKRESSKAADDYAERAAEEKMMLLGDLKHDKDFQPRFASTKTRFLISGSKFLYTRRNGRRNKLRSRRIKLRMAPPEVKSVCFIWRKQANQTTKPPSSQYSNSTFKPSKPSKRNNSNKHLAAKLSVPKQPMESVRIQLNWRLKLLNKALLPLYKLNKILRHQGLRVVLFLELDLKIN